MEDNNLQWHEIEVLGDSFQNLLDSFLHFFYHFWWVTYIGINLKQSGLE